MAWESTWLQKKVHCAPDDSERLSDSNCAEKQSSRAENKKRKNKNSKNDYEKDHIMIRKCQIFIYETLSNKIWAFSQNSKYASTVLSLQPVYT